MRSSKESSFLRSDFEIALFLIAPIDSEASTFIPEVKIAGVPIVKYQYIFDRHEGASLTAQVHNWISRRWREKSLNRQLYEDLEDYDAIICFQPFVVDLLLPNIRESQKICFHVSEHIAQRKQPLSNKVFTNRRLKHVFQHQSQILQLDFKMDLSKSIIWPLRLCADHLRDPLEATPERSGVLRIAHYSRISPMRFIDRIIDAFSLLQQSTSAELRIAGFVEDLEYHQKC